MGAFSDEVFEIVCQIPRGKVATYGLVARLMGRPRSARYVGFALRSNPRPGIDPGSIPCHRVVFRDGSLCKGFAFGGPDVQYRRLKAEGVTFVEDAKAAADSDAGALFVDDEGVAHSLETLRVDMKACLWDGCPQESDGQGEGYPTEPPADFDWASELGEL
ncbi:MAG: MGMT family protein [Coriobacteriales bacterium]|jgi:methylated-DNA-protein-cysteine methyltransferase-like protein